MLAILSKVFGRDSASKDVAKERLKLVLVHDRASISPHVLDALKNDLIRVIKEYVEVDQQNLEVSLTNAEDQVALVANIPIKGLRRRGRGD